MTNEVLFIIQIATVSLGCIFSFKLGKEALCAFVCLQALAANLLVAKQIVLFGLNTTGSDAFAISSSLGLILLQEKFGYAQAQKTIWISFYLLSLFTVISQIHIAFMPSAQDGFHRYYVPLLSTAPRILVASMFAFLCSQFVDTKLYRFLILHKYHYSAALRTFISIMVSQLVDTVLFTVIALYGMHDHLSHILFFSYSIKLLICFLLIPITRYAIQTAPHQSIPID